MNVRINKKSNKKEIKIFFLIIILFLIPIGGIFSLGIFPHMRIQKDKNDLYNEISLIYINAVGTTKEWSIDIDSPSYSSPIIVDIDRDGSKDIIIGFGVGTKGGIYCIENNGSIKWIFNTYYTVKSSPAVADLDHDGLLDIVFTCGNSKTYCLNFNGTQKWVYDIGYTSYITPCISDLDADGNFEIIVGGGKTKVAGTINCLSFDGTEKWIFPTDGFSFSSATVADLNRDGNLEVLIGCTESGSFYCLDSLGILIWSKNLGTISVDGFDWGIAGSPIVADIDNDLEYEIIIGNTWNTTFCFIANGDQEWNITMPNYEFYFTPV
ncbi:MAG: hypothetical protein EAX90_11240, partial [Candidatus Heimdallarchaeota archaeon]|nr:hypothetical protein [Candidatus Heimdallarchaeota archaeon]